MSHDTKHYDVQLQYIRENIQQPYDIILTHIDTDKNIADLCTKSLASQRQDDHAMQIKKKVHKLESGKKNTINLIDNDDLGRKPQNDIQKSLNFVCL